MNQYSLSEFNKLIKDTLEQNLEMTYWIVAEIGDINIHSKGHCYLELVERDNNHLKAKLRATIWSYTFSQIHTQFIQTTGSSLQAGMKVLINGTLQFHELYGLSLNINDVDPTYTLGEREKKKEETIIRLKEEELLDKNSQTILPIVPQKIAIVSSESAAGYGDFIDQVRHNEWGYQLSLQLFPATMQGGSAAKSIIESLHRIEGGFDLVAIIRGGGAKTDLDCFDEYELCSAIAEMSIPVITGIGHERDETIADMVAHTNLKTPTAVAEFIISGILSFENQILQWMDSISKTANNAVSENQLQLQHFSTMIDQIPGGIINNEKLQIQLFEKIIEGNDPRSILRKGFSITRKDGKIIMPGEKVVPGEQITTQLADQEIESTVTKNK